MDKFISFSGKAIPLAMDDVNTDLIIRVQDLATTSTVGYGESLFKSLKLSEPNCVFNQPKFKDASILISGNNFGCGSSREQAVWAIAQAGYKVVIASSFADIFFNNSTKYGLLLLTLPQAVIHELLLEATEGNCTLSVNLPEQAIQTSSGKSYKFEIDDFRKYCFVNGMDELDYILLHRKEIDAFKDNQVEKHWWKNLN